MGYRVRGGVKSGGPSGARSVHVLHVRGGAREAKGGGAYGHPPWILDRGEMQCGPGSPVTIEPSVLIVFLLLAFFSRSHTFTCLNSLFEFSCCLLASMSVLMIVLLNPLDLFRSLIFPNR